MSVVRVVLPEIIKKDFLKRIESNGNVYKMVIANLMFSANRDPKTIQHIIQNGVSTWHIYDCDEWKYFYNDEHTYHCFFSKMTGFTVRISEDISKPDPIWCDLGPEILDLEISVNGCPKVGGKNCKFCYKNNSDAEPTNMTFETFKTIFDKFPKSLYSIAFGITGVQTNPDFPKMLQYCRENGVVPNYTLSGADLNDEIMSVTTKYCGAVAVSCYEGNRQLCYDTIKRMYEESNKKLHVNMHIVLSEDKTQLDHIWTVLNDIKDKKITGLRNVVFLRMKPVGRASKLNCVVSDDTYKKIIGFCMDNNIGFGFDSCGAKIVQKVLTDMGKGEYSQYCESCESTRFSLYCNVFGKATPCSFVEHIYEKDAWDLIKCKDFSRGWVANKMICGFRKKNIECKESCSIYDLDTKETK